MDSFDVSLYYPLFLTSYKDCLDNVKTIFPPQSDHDKSELHRFFHMMKGQNSFMGYHNTANYCLLLERIFYSLKTNRLVLNEDLTAEMFKVISVLEENLKSLETQKKEIDFNEKTVPLQKFI